MTWHHTNPGQGAPERYFSLAGCGCWKGLLGVAAYQPSGAADVEMPFQWLGDQPIQKPSARLIHRQLLVVVHEPESHPSPQVPSGQTGGERWGAARRATAGAARGRLLSSPHVYLLVLAVRFCTTLVGNWKLFICCQGCKTPAGVWQIHWDLCLCWEPPCLLMFEIFLEVVLWFSFSPFSGPQPVRSRPRTSLPYCTFMGCTKAFYKSLI